MVDFELAYDLEVAPGNEVVFVRSDDRHRKVRVLVTEASRAEGNFSFSGHSLGSSVREIKAAKKTSRQSWSVATSKWSTASGKVSYNQAELSLTAHSIA